MSVTVLIPSNTQRLTTLAAVMAEVPLADQLNVAESLIDQASAAVARHCGAIFAQQKYREVQGEWGQTGCLFLRHRPIVSVSMVSYGDTDITDWRIESAEAGILWRHGGWWLWGDAEWTVEYVAGYVLPEQLTPPDPTGPMLPDDLERATIETVKVWFHERMVGSRIESRTLGDQRIDYGVQARKTGIPALAKDLLVDWQRVRVA
jgi:hypothetical protein